MSDTPRTDAVDAKCNELELKDAIFYAIFHFGKLERELNAANTIIRQQQLLDEENLRLKERIKRLEELGKELRECANLIGTYQSNEMETIDRSDGAVQAWDKEAKL